MVLPTLLFKGLVIGMKQITKPLAKSTSNYLVTHPQAKRAIVNLAQRFHQMDMYIRFYGDESKRRHIGTITDDRAIELAQDTLIEFATYSLTFGVVWLEYSRSQAESAEKKEKEARTRAEWEAQSTAQRDMLYKLNDHQEALIAGLALRLDALEQELQMKRGEGAMSWFRKRAGSAAAAADD